MRRLILEIDSEQQEGDDKKKTVSEIAVYGLLVIAFVAPMVQYWFYTAGD